MSEKKKVKGATKSKAIPIWICRPKTGYIMIQTKKLPILNDETGRFEFPKGTGFFYSPDFDGFLIPGEMKIGEARQVSAIAFYFVAEHMD